MSKQIGTRLYTNSHRRSPRGYGRWGFIAKDTGGCESAVHFTPGSMNYGEACKWARKQPWFREALSVEAAP